MSITKYFTQRNNKVISDKPTPACSPLLLVSLASSTTIPATQATPLLNKDNNKQDNLHLSWSWTLLLGLADTEEREEQENKKENKFQRHQEARAFTGDSPHPPHHPNEPDVTLPARPNDANDDDDNNVFVDTLQTLQDEAESKERKEWLWQLLSQRSGVQVTPTILVVAGLSSSAHFATNTPRTSPREQPFSSRSGCREQQRKKKLGKSSRHLTW